MNSRQRTVLWVAVATGVLMGLVPPWKHTRSFSWHGQSDNSSRPAGYAFIASPPDTVPIFPGMANSRMAQFGVGVGIDTVRLAVQYTVLAVLTAGVLLSLNGARGEGAGQSRKNAAPVPYVVQPPPRPESPLPVGEQPATSPPAPARPSPWHSLSPDRYRLRPLTRQASGYLVASTLAFVVAYALFSNAWKGPRSAVAGAFLGTVVGLFGICVAVGWGTAAMAWKACQKSQKAAVGAFISGAIAAFVWVMVGSWRVEQVRQQRAGPTASAVRNRFGDTVQPDSFDRINPSGSTARTVFGDIAINPGATARPTQIPPPPWEADVVIKRNNVGRSTLSKNRFGDLPVRPNQGSPGRDEFGGNIDERHP